MAGKYDASDIEVLSGLDPVRKRPGMYTDISRPNHLAHEVIDNSVDEAISGYAKKIQVTLFKDGSLEVVDDGRGMPVDKHPKLKLPGVEVVLSTLHAGGKFSDKNYTFSGGLHGVGSSVVNACDDWKRNNNPLIRQSPCCRISDAKTARWRSSYAGPRWSGWTSSNGAQR